MNRLILSIVAVVIAAAASISAVADDNRNKPSKEEFRKWMREMIEYKHEFLTSELELTKEQQDKFFPLYDQMNRRIHELEHQTRELERTIDGKNGRATDLEYEKAAEAMFELQRRCADIEMEYYPQLKKELTPRQLFKLKKAERKFMKKIMHHRRKDKK